MNDELLSNLIDNGFDFLEKGIDQFKDDPKYSVINFCAAVELLLKARLMHEHWSLVVSSPNNSHPNIQKFRSGDFKSINFTDLVPRIEAVTGEKIPKDATIAFKRLADHRNKMIHFFHEAHFALASGKLLEEIAIEQCNCWFYLRRLLEKWQTIFSDDWERIAKINYKMKSHDIYLNTVYDRISDDLENDKKKGIIFSICNRCSKNASEETQVTDFLYQYNCRVCLYQANILKVPCQADGCENILAISDDPFQEFICASGHTFNLGELSDLLDSDPATPDNYFEQVDKNCAICLGLNTVVEHEANYICTACLHVSGDIEYCGWCGEGQIGGGSLENSHYSGCEFCEGQTYKDD